eukprot:786091-Amphidinium_carterae.1
MHLNWRKSVRVLSCFGLYANSVAGVLPRSGFTEEVWNIDAKQNHFAGSLPEGSMRAMMTVTYFSIGQNSFTGGWRSEPR